MSLFDSAGLVERPELIAVREALRRMMDRFGPEYWRVCDAERSYPSDFMFAMAEAGYMGTLIPESDGGLGLGASVASVIVEEINRAGGDAAVINAQMSIGGLLVREGTPEQKAYLPYIADGSTRLLTVAATEPDSGADMSHLSSVAFRSGGGWIVEARKVFISLAEHTHLMVLLVRTDEGPTLFLLDLREVGSEVEIRPVDLMANRMTTVLFVDGLRVSDACRLGPVGGGLRCLQKGFALRRVLAASESIGNARFFLQRSVEHARERVTFGRPIGSNQGIQFPLAQAYTKTEAADLMRWDAIRCIERAVDAGERSALAKILASEAAWEAARAALTVFGGWGLASEMHIERKVRDAAVFVFNNMLLCYVAENVLALPTH